MLHDPSAALSAALTRDLSTRTDEQLEQVLTEHGWLLQEQDYTVRRLWHTPDNKTRVALSPPEDQWGQHDRANMFSRFVEYHELAVSEGLRRFGVL